MMSCPSDIIFLALFQKSCYSVNAVEAGRPYHRMMATATRRAAIDGHSWSESPPNRNTAYKSPGDTAQGRRARRKTTRAALLVASYPTGCGPKLCSGYRRMASIRGNSDSANQRDAQG